MSQVSVFNISTIFGLVLFVSDKIAPFDLRAFSPSSLPCPSPSLGFSDMAATVNDELELILAKIRCHSGSTAPAQRGPAQLLHALEATMADQATSPTPAAHFAALLTMLDQAIKRAATTSAPLEEGAILPSTLYLLAAVMPTMQAPLIRNNVPTLLPLLVQIFPALTNHVGLLCSQIVVLSTLLRSLEAPQFSTHQLRQAYASLLELTMDTRQKVRSHAQYAVKEVLATPPPPMARHPYLEQTAEYVLGVLGVVAGKVAKKGAEAGSEVGVWCCGFVKSLSEAWPESVSREVLNKASIY